MLTPVRAEQTSEFIHRLADQLVVLPARASPTCRWLSASRSRCDAVPLGRKRSFSRSGNVRFRARLQRLRSCNTDTFIFECLEQPCIFGLGALYDEPYAVHRRRRAKNKTFNAAGKRTLLIGPRTSFPPPTLTAAKSKG